jgi:hypothetical protein
VDALKALHVDIVKESIVQVITLHFGSVYGCWRVFLRENYSYLVVIGGLYKEHYKHVPLHEYCGFPDFPKLRLQVEVFSSVQQNFDCFDALYKAWLVVELGELFNCSQNASGGPLAYRLRYYNYTSVVEQQWPDHGGTFFLKLLRRYYTHRDFQTLK